MPGGVESLGCMTQDPNVEEPDVTERDLSLIGTLENLEEQATRDFLAGDYGPPRGPLPEPTCRTGRAVPSSAKVAAWHLIDAENRTVSERKLFALVDAAACILDHERNGQETARLVLETAAGPAVALAALRTLTGEDR